MKNVNAHFSDDILSTLLNEPIPGHGVFWSSVGGKSYPIPLRVLSFENAYSAIDPRYNKPPANTFAAALKKRFTAAIAAAHAVAPPLSTVGGESAQQPSEPAPDADAGFGVAGGGEAETPAVVDSSGDVLAAYSSAAIQKVSGNSELMERIKSERGIPWMGVQTPLQEALPDILDDTERKNIAYGLVTRFLDEAIGHGKWRTEKRPKVSGSGMTTWIIGQK